MKIPATILAVSQETPTVKSINLDLGGQDFSFLPGQWIDCYVEIDGHEEVAGFSMTSSPLVHGSIDLAVKLLGENPVTHYLHERATVGDIVYVEGGQGEFYYRREMGDSLVLIGGGIGITPLMSIMRYVDEAAPEVRATLLYSAKSPDELLFRDVLAQMAGRNGAVRCLFSVTQPVARPWDGLTGRIDAAMVARAGIDLDALLYLCGPPPMITDVAATLEGLGVPAGRIKYELW